MYNVILQQLNTKLAKAFEERGLVMPAKEPQEVLDNIIDAYGPEGIIEVVLPDVDAYTTFRVECHMDANVDNK